MRNIRRILRITLFVLFGMLLHYALPQKDVARITGTDTIRQDFSSFNRWFFAQADSGNVEAENRDVLFITVVRQQTYLFGLIRGGDDVMVYRNEDTGWIWPPYFKFDTRDLQGEAQDLVSTAEAPKWVTITHYGWRNRFFTIFPNAIAVKQIDGSDYRPFPWFNLFFFVFLTIGGLFIRAMWMQFRERTLDPIADRAGDKLDHVNADIAKRRGRIRRWLDSWKTK